MRAALAAAWERVKAAVQYVLGDEQLHAYAGLALVAIGAEQVYAAAGFIVAGLGLWYMAVWWVPPEERLRLKAMRERDAGGG